MTRSVMFNVRVDDDLDEAIEAAADAAGLKKSVWAREVMGAVALGGVSLEALADLVRGSGVRGTPHPPRYLALQGQTGRQTRKQAGCLHPVTARKRLPFTDVCGVCGATVRDLR